MILTFENQVLVCGRNSEDQLGIKKEYCEKNINNHECISRFTFLNNINIEYILAGGTHSVLIDNCNKMTILGNNNFSDNLPDHFNKILACGSDSVIYV